MKKEKLEVIAICKKCGINNALGKKNRCLGCYNKTFYARIDDKRKQIRNKFERIIEMIKA